MKIVSIIIAAAASVSLSVLTDAPVEYTNSGFRADTMITTDCELILFGKDVPPVTHEGVRGYWISRDDTSVTCNGITCMTVSTYFTSKTVVTPAIERNVRIKRRAAEVIWRSREANDGLIVLDGELRRSGDVFQVPVPDESTTVTVRLTGDRMTLTPEGDDIGPSEYSIDRHHDMSREELHEWLVRGAYQGMIDALVPGC